MQQTFSLFFLFDIQHTSLYPHFTNPKGKITNTMRLKTLFFKAYIFLLIIVALMALINVTSCYAAIRTVTGIVTKISDGDTIHLTTPEQTKLKVRLYGIDAPETPKINAHSGQVNKLGQPYGEESWKALERKSWGGKSNWTFWTLTNTNEWLE